MTISIAASIVELKLKICTYSKIENENASASILLSDATTELE